MEKIDLVKTAADLNRLPSFLRLSLRSVGQTTGGLEAYRSQAERKAQLQVVVPKAVREGFITLRLAVEILETNGAYGQKGKACLKGLEETTS